MFKIEDADFEGTDFSWVFCRAVEATAGYSNSSYSSTAMHCLIFGGTRCLGNLNSPLPNWHRRDRSKVCSDVALCDHRFHGGAVGKVGVPMDLCQVFCSSHFTVLLCSLLHWVVHWVVKALGLALSCTSNSRATCLLRITGIEGSMFQRHAVQRFAVERSSWLKVTIEARFVCNRHIPGLCRMKFDEKRHGR